jgi:serralysin
MSKSMSLLVVSLLSTFLLVSIFIIPIHTQENTDPSSSSGDDNSNENTDDFAVPSIPHVCYAPAGPTAESAPMMEKVEALQTELENNNSTHAHARYRYLGSRWSQTIRSGRNLIRGQPTIITWSIVPDGTVMASPLGEPVANSNLRAFLSGIYGANGYVPWIQSVLDMWSSVSGLTYVYEPNDDGTALRFDGTGSGALNARGDMRIAGHPIDGNSGILAYCYSPNVGDMVIDTGDNFYSLQKQYAANVIVHEAAHGFGLGHTCPMDKTKLMEPYLSTSFIGPQHDDIRGAHRLYGDILEPNNDLSTAKSIGLADNGIAYMNLSLDDITDKDFFSFNVGSKTDVTISLAPVGKSYVEGVTGSGSSPCSVAGVNQNSLNVIDLAMTLHSSSGSVMSVMNAKGVGNSETIRAVLNPSTTYKLQVHPAASVTLPASGMYVQMYSLKITSTTATTGSTASRTPSPSRSRVPASPSGSPSRSKAPASKSPSPSKAPASKSPSPSRIPSRSASRSASRVPSRSPSRSPSPVDGAVCPPTVAQQQPLYTTMQVTNGDQVLMNCQCVPVDQ